MPHRNIAQEQTLDSLTDPVTGTVPHDWFERFGTGPKVRPRFETIIAAIEDQVSRHPNAIAAEWAGQSTSYNALDTAANRLATVLRAKGVKHGDAVCLYLARSIPMLVGILAAMKVGAAYVPQHLGVAPEITLRHISKVTKAKVILTQSGRANSVPINPGQSLVVIDDVICDTSISAAPVPTPTQAQDRCMVLFTSGTTGTPNGVQVTHKNLANILLTAPGDLGIKPGMRVGQILSVAFDMAAWEILGCLGNGGTLVIRGADIQEVAENVDVLIATPSILGTLDANRCQQIKCAAVAGEPCPRPLADTWGAFCTFYNSCGPTETTIINTAIRHTPDKPDLTIGTPTPNNTVYILDDDLKPLPFGEKGEMWAGGECVTAGYLANDVLTADRYRPDPFRPGHLMFRTKDLGRWTAKGELRHCGRVDDLVKIRGFRVELDGVSRALEQTDNCQQAVTLKYDDRTLVAFVSPANVCPDAATKAVANALPYYCVPQAILPIEELPRTARGKLDKRRLLAIADANLNPTTTEAAQ